MVLLSYSIPVGPVEQYYADYYGITDDDASDYNNTDGADDEPAKAELESYNYNNSDMRKVYKYPLFKIDDS